MSVASNRTCGGLTKALRIFIRSIFTGTAAECLSIVLFATLSARAVPPGVCHPAPEIRDQLQQAAAVPAADPTAFEQNVAPFLALRQRHPTDLFVHERYQDAVQQNGIEGHLRALTEEYQSLAAEHPGDVMYSYLSARALIGRSTPAAIASLTDIVDENPSFAPAHRSLAEIYGSGAFRDPVKEKLEREKFRALCPGSPIVQFSVTPPGPSRLVDQAERLLSEGGDPIRAAAMAMQGIRDDEWRLQRIRPFDWYSVEYKRQAQEEVERKYWQLWTIQVRSYRKTNQPEQAAELLDLMSQRAGRLNRAAPAYWDAQTDLARLYIEGRQLQQATERLEALNDFLNQHPDPNRAVILADLRRLVNRSNN